MGSAADTHHQDRSKLNGCSALRDALRGSVGGSKCFLLGPRGLFQDSPDFVERGSLW